LDDNFLYYSKDKYSIINFLSEFFPGGSKPDKIWYRYNLITNERVVLKTPKSYLYILGKI
jgi:hypothetical protein